MLTKRLSELVGSAHQRPVDDGARELAKLSIVDTVATMLAGRHEPAASIVHGALATARGHALEAYGLNYVDPQSAAMINAVAAHALDYDDVALRGHPGAVMVPALLALAQEINATGERVLDAYIVGYQVWGELALSDRDLHHIKGWHPTGVFGPIGAAAACATLLRMEAAPASNALALGAAQSSGLTVNFGTMAKPFQAGRAAQSGVMAALLAQNGFTAASDVFEHPRGFLRAYSPAGNVSLPAGGDGEPWLITSKPISIKKYPTCYYTHRAIDAALALRKHMPADCSQVKDVAVLISREHASVLKNHQPRDPLAAKFSIEFAVACALMHGAVSLALLSEQIVRDERLQALMRKVRVVEASQYAATWAGAARWDQLAITWADGSHYESDKIYYAKGDANSPLERDDLERKFRDCLAYSDTSLNGDKLLGRLWSLEQYSAREVWDHNHEIY